jgi:hypothetical protein
MHAVAIRFSAVIVACAVPSLMSSCSFSRDGSGSGASSRWDDSVYAVQLAKFVHDSTLMDSLTRQVRTDSLYTLYRRAVSGEVGAAVVQALSCEELRLRLHYGTAPAGRAMKRMRDTVYRDQGITKDAFEFFAARAPAEGEIDSGRCSPPSGHFPAIIQGMRTDVEPGRQFRIR